LTWSLRCHPAGGTLPRRQRACRVLTSLRDPFRPVPPGTICTGLNGGPAVAVVRGTFRGRRVWSVFKRNDGCQIERWNRVRVLFPITVAPPT
jgi:Subtilisin inhibitor-like